MPITYVQSDVDVELGAGCHRADDLWAGGLRGGLCGDAGLGMDGLYVGE